MAIRAANGKELTLTFSKENPPHNPDMGSDIDDVIWEAIGAQALQGLKMAYDAAPVHKTPHIIMGDFSTNATFRRQSRDAARRMGHPDQIADRMAETTWGFVYSKEDPNGDPLPVPVGKIAINATKTNMERILIETGPKDTMHTGFPEVPIMTYTAVHEYGHHRYWQGPDKTPPWEAKMLYTEFQNHPDMSKYGKTNFKESHAEAFADWVFRGTATDVTKAYQDSFGWGEHKEALAAIRSDEALPEDDPDEYGVIETWDYGAIPLVPLDSENAVSASSEVRESVPYRQLLAEDSDRIQLL
jgi:hypothetical protein